jgi:predicted metalloprotease
VRRLLPLVLLAGAMLLPACGGSDVSAAPEGTGTIHTVAQRAAPHMRRIGEAREWDLSSRRQREAKVLRDAGELEPVLNRFWKRELKRRYDIAFDAPDALYWYRGAEDLRCDGRRITTQSNAYYCDGPRDFVAFDLDWLQGYSVQEGGTQTTVFVLAHEWGHAVQNTWTDEGGDDVWYPPYRRELSADCLAGVFLASRGELISDADGDAILSWMVTTPTVPWLVPDDHGTSRQRRTAVNDGSSRGIDYCRLVY